MKCAIFIFFVFLVDRWIVGVESPTVREKERDPAPLRL